MSFTDTGFEIMSVVSPNSGTCSFHSNNQNMYMALRKKGFDTHKTPGW